MDSKGNQIQRNVNNVPWKVWKTLALDSTILKYLLVEPLLRLLFWSSIGPGKENHPEHGCEVREWRFKSCRDKAGKTVILGWNKQACCVQVRRHTSESTWSEKGRTSWPLALMMVWMAIHPDSRSERGAPFLTLVFFLVKRLVLWMD